MGQTNFWYGTRSGKDKKHKEYFRTNTHFKIFVKKLSEIRTERLLHQNKTWLRIITELVTGHYLTWTEPVGLTGILLAENASKEPK